MSWVDTAQKKAERILSHEDELLKEAYSPEFAELAKKEGLYFSFGDITHLIRTGLSHSIFIRNNGGHAGIAHFEDLIKRFRLYLMREMRLVMNNQPPFHDSRRVVYSGVDYGFIIDFLDLFKILDDLDEQLKEIRKREGGCYQ
jgi:hypothetical protein